MGPLDPDLEPEGRLPPLPGQLGSRPRPASSASGAPTGRPQAPLQSNRPIPLKSQSPGSIPDTHDDDDDEEDVAEDLKEILRNAPAWLISTVFHMSLLIVLGLLAVANKSTMNDVAIEVAREDPIGTQLEDPSILEGDSTRLENPHDPEQTITPTDLPPVDDPLASPLEIGELKLGPTSGAITGPVTIEGAPIGLALKGRQIGSRNVLLGKYGGTSGTEGAVEAGLAWLAKQQRSDGTWSLTGPYSDGSRTGENSVAATAMALLAFQGHGDTHRDGQYSKNVARGWTALLKMQRKDGQFSGTMSSRNELLYAHAQATIALCELYGMTHDSTYRGPAVRAIEYAVSVQDKNLGGWRYIPGQDSDTSVTGWFVMALQSARMAGLSVPEAALSRVTSYLDRAQIDGGRRYGYWQALQPTNAVCAEGLLCRQYLGWPQDDERLVEGVSALNKNPITYVDSNAEGEFRFRGEQDAYYWYYATQATHHMEGTIWDEWNKVMRVEVPEHQVKKGAEAGSWNPQTDKWGSAGGRLYVTCLSIYMLEVYYRHLPLYSGYGSFAAVESAGKGAVKSATAAEDSADKSTTASDTDARDPDAEDTTSAGAADEKTETDKPETKKAEAADGKTP
jgi:hypothetical protein